MDKYILGISIADVKVSLIYTNIAEIISWGCHLFHITGDHNYTIGILYSGDGRLQWANNSESYRRISGLRWLMRPIVQLTIDPDAVVFVLRTDGCNMMADDFMRRITRLLLIREK